MTKDAQSKKTLVQSDRCSALATDSTPSSLRTGSPAGANGRFCMHALPFLTGACFLAASHDPPVAKMHVQSISAACLARVTHDQIRGHTTMDCMSDRKLCQRSIFGCRIRRSKRAAVLGTHLHDQDDLRALRPGFQHSCPSAPPPPASLLAQTFSTNRRTCSPGCKLTALLPDSGSTPAIVAENGQTNPPQQSAVIARSGFQNQWLRAPPTAQLLSPKRSARTVCRVFPCPEHSPQTLLISGSSEKPSQQLLPSMRIHVPSFHGHHRNRSPRSRSSTHQLRLQNAATNHFCKKVHACVPGSERPSGSVLDSKHPKRSRQSLAFLQNPRPAQASIRSGLWSHGQHILASLPDESSFLKQPARSYDLPGSASKAMPNRFQIFGNRIEHDYHPVPKLQGAKGRLGLNSLLSIRSQNDRSGQMETH